MDRSAVEMPQAESSMPALVRFEQVRTVRSGPDGRQTPLLDGISLSARRGELTVIIGPSGGGKSSLIRLVNRLEDPAAGRILLDGADIATLDPLQLRCRVGMMLQKAYMFEGSVLFNLQQPFRYRQLPVPSADDPELLRCLQLARLPLEFLERDARSLSGGEQQRVNLARALVSRPQVLLLDEPTSALDRPTADRLATTLREVCHTEQLAILMVTHDLRLAGKVADRLVYLEQGRVVEEGDATLLTNPCSEAFRRFLAEPEDE